MVRTTIKDIISSIAVRTNSREIHDVGTQRTDDILYIIFNLFHDIYPHGF